MALTTAYTNNGGYTHCRSDGGGGGYAEMNLSGNVVGSATGTTC